MTVRKIFGVVFFVLAALCGAYLLIFINIVFWNIQYCRDHDWINSMAGTATVFGLIFLSIAGHLYDKNS